jgi:hypothetical protein
LIRDCLLCHAICVQADERGAMYVIRRPLMINRRPRASGGSNDPA